MNNVFDMGGLQGYGKVKRDPDEPLFKQRWEALVFAASRLVSVGTIDEKRYTRESMDPVEYLNSSYYELWLHSMEELYLKYGLMTEEELKNPEGSMSRVEDFQAVKVEDVEKMFQGGRSSGAHVDVPASFKVGDEVLVRNEHPVTHTRCPFYVRGHRGQVDRDYGVFHFPDHRAHGLEPKPQHCYSVRFEASELWGSQGNPRDVIYLDLFDDYLEAAPSCG